MATNQKPKNKGIIQKLVETAQKFIGSGNLHGVNYQTKVATLYLYRGRSLKNFQLATEVTDAGKFDDLIFCYEDENAQKKKTNIYFLLQAKHLLTNEESTSGKKITLQELRKEEGPFSLVTYFKSYLDIREKNEGLSIASLILFTNEDFDYKKINGIVIENVSCKEIDIIADKNVYRFAKVPSVMRIRLLELNKATDKMLKEFLEKLVFAVKQPNYQEIEKTIKLEISSVYNLIEDATESIFQANLGEMWNIQSNYEGRVMTPQWIKERFEKVSKDLKDKYVSGISIMKRKDKVVFENYFDDIDAMSKFLKRTNASQFSYILTDTPALACLKVAQTMQSIHNSISSNSELYFAVVDHHALEINQDRIREAFQNKLEFTLAIKCDNKEEKSKAVIETMLKKLDQVQPNEEGEFKKKVVLLVSGEQNFQPIIKDICDFKNIKNKDSLMNFKISFQGIRVKLSNLINKVNFGKLKSNVNLCDEIISQFFEDDTLSIGKKLDNFEAIDSFYIEPLFKKNFKFDESLLQNIPDSTVLVFSGMEKSELKNRIPDQNLLEFQEISSELGSYRVIFLNNSRDKAEDFSTICNNLKSKDIHWLENSNDAFNDCIKVKKSVHNIHVTMNKYINDSKTVNVLIGEPGAGKSVAFTKIMNKIKDKNPEHWVIKINLLSHCSTLEKLGKKYVKIEDILDFLGKTEGIEKNWEKEMLRYTMMETNHGHLFFDGFDEICPTYETTVMHMLKLCKETKARIWVSSGPQFQTNLEKELECFSYSPIPFTSEQQKSFLERYWKHSLTDKAGENVIQNLFRIKESRIRLANAFIGIPLQTFMLADICLGIYRKEGKNYDDRSNKLDNILLFYDIFITEKCHYFLEKAEPYTGYADKARCKSSFYTIHKNAAVTLLFSQELKSLLTDVEASTEIEEEMWALLLKENSCLNFTHRTFAEYFVAKRLAEILKDRKHYSKTCQKVNTVINFLRVQYHAEANTLIREFFDLMMANSDVHKVIINNDISLVMRLDKDDKACVLQTDSIAFK